MADRLIILAIILVVGGIIVLAGSGIIGLLRKVSVFNRFFGLLEKDLFGDEEFEDEEFEEICDSIRAYKRGTKDDRSYVHCQQIGNPTR